MRNRLGRIWPVQKNHENRPGWYNENRLGRYIEKTKNSRIKRAGIMGVLYFVRHGESQWNVEDQDLVRQRMSR